MTALAPLLLVYATNALWQVPLVFAAAWLLSRAVRHIGSPLLEHRIWVAALLLQTLLPALSPPAQRLALFLESLLHNTAGSGTSPGVSVTLGSVLPLSRDAAILQFLPRAYLAALLLLLARFLWQAAGTLYLRRTAVPLQLAPEQAVMLRHLEDRLHLGPVHLATHPRVHTPVTFGARAPVILLPAALLADTSQLDFRTALAHELVHIQRRDFLTNLLLRALTVPVAWHPALWLTRQAAAHTREVVCDRRAAELTGGAALYRRGLLGLATRLLSGAHTAPALPSTHTVGIFDANSFERRLTMLDRNPLTPGRTARTALLGLAALTATLTCGTAVALGGAPTTASTTAGTGNSQDGQKPVQLPSGVAAGQIVSKVMPKYPPEAKQAKVSGIVLLHAIIGKDGKVDDLTVISGPPELRASALEAVHQWVYQPWLLNGEPTAVETTITVNYSFGG